MATLTDPQRQAAAEPIPALLRKRDIRRLYLPVSGRCLDRMISAGKFPRPDLRLSGKAVFWRRETVEAWLSTVGQAEEVAP